MSQGEPTVGYDAADELEALRIALDALKQIAESDPGPAYFIAGIALDEIKALGIPLENVP